MTIDTHDAMAALGGRGLRAQRLPSRLAIATDTRAIAGGETFLALRGDRFDGHHFVADAFERGAAACIVSDPARVPDERPAILVHDTLEAYLCLARVARRKAGSTVAAISGSTGKTTTKTFLLQLLAAAGVPAVATPENENNEIGVSKFLLGLEESDPRIAIVEMGARKYRDLDPLVDAALPDVGILTNIGEAHLEIFGTRERLADTKWGLFGTGARAVINLEDPVARTRAGELKTPPLWFGTGSTAPPPGAPGVVVRDAETLLIHDGTARTEHPIDVQFPGAHNRANLAAALAGAIALGCAPAALAPLVGATRLPHGRYEAVAIAGNRRVIFDAYNASLSGTLATLATFAGEHAERRIAVLGSMAELGPRSGEMHARAGAAAAAAADILLAGGDFADDIVSGARAAGMSEERIVRYADNAVAVAWLREHMRAGDVILLKGSRKYTMEEIAGALGAGTFA